METTIKDWIRIAQKISQHLLQKEGTSTNEDVRKWQQEKTSHRKILNELSKPGFYARHAKRREDFEEKYNWDHFIASQQRKALHRRLQIIGYAASVIVLLSVGVIFRTYIHEESKSTIVAVPLPFNPGSMKALLILGDGKKIALNDSLTIKEKDGTIIQNSETGGLAYEIGNPTDSSLQYNTLCVPRGGEYRLTLPDGTRVWVNSESELRFPTRFTESKREVFLKGEAYFEIAHNENQPFYVESQDIKVCATGTAFNVTAYKDEQDIKVTLVEGGVNIEKEEKIISKLKPNEQFTQKSGEDKFRVITVDPRVGTAWKNGSFFFADESLESIIRKLSRWYNINIQCSKAELYQYKFSGEVRKYENAFKVLDMLKLTNEITYTIQSDQEIMIHPTK